MAAQKETVEEGFRAWYAKDKSITVGASCPRRSDVAFVPTRIRNELLGSSLILSQGLNRRRARDTAI